MASTALFTARLASRTAHGSMAAISAARLMARSRNDVKRHDLVHHAAFPGLLCRQRGGGEQDVLGPPGPEFPGVGEELHSGHPHQADRVGELGVLRSDDQITGPAQHESGGDALTLDGGDRWRDEIAPPPGVVQIPAFLPVEVGIDGQCPIDSLWTERGDHHHPAYRDPLRSAFPRCTTRRPGLRGHGPKRSMRRRSRLEHLWALRIGRLRAVDVMTATPLSTM